MPKLIAMITARMGSQRLKKKNLRKLCGTTLIERAIKKCQLAGCFDEVWVNSEDLEFKAIAEKSGAYFHQRPLMLGDNDATSEDFVTEFLVTHDCDYLFQVHSIAPLLYSDEVRDFTKFFVNSEYDVLLSCIEDQIEVAFDNKPINFSFNSKLNSQDLSPVQRITWSITGWKKEVFLSAVNNGGCATFTGKIGFFPVSAISGHVIKTKEDLAVAESLMKVNL